MTLAVVQSQGFGVAGAGGFNLLSNTWTTTTGNLVVACFRNGSGATISSVGDSQGNPWNPLTRVTNGTVELQFWYAINIVGGTGNITANFSTAVNAPNGAAWEISGADQNNPLDAQATGQAASGSSGTVTTSSFSTTSPNEIVLGMSTWNGNNVTVFPLWTWSGGGGLVEDLEWPPTTATNWGIISASHVIVSSLLTSITASASWAASGASAEFIGIATFKAAPIQIPTPSMRPSYGTGRSIDFRVMR